MHAQSLSLVQLCVTPWTVAHQAPLSMGFSRQIYQSSLPFPPPAWNTINRNLTQEKSERNLRMMGNLRMTAVCQMRKETNQTEAVRPQREKKWWRATTTIAPTPTPTLIQTFKSRTNAQTVWPKFFSELHQPADHSCMPCCLTCCGQCLEMLCFDLLEELEGKPW